MNPTSQIAVFGGGCFWCTEAVFKNIRGVMSIIPGYAGGQSPNPTYESVCSGQTGHAEVVKIEFNPQEISYRDLLTVFFASHDPTTPNHQRNDVGTQYRSVILYTGENQRREAEGFIARINEDDGYVVTEVRPLEKFFPAEEYHRDYFAKNPDKAYCQAVINPKLAKIQKEFSALIKTHTKE